MTYRDDRVYLLHILECAELIQDYIRNGKAEFMENALIQDAVLRRLQIMAESTQRLSNACKADALAVDWRALAGFRNVLVHDYLGGIDLERVWTAVECLCQLSKLQCSNKLRRKMLKHDAISERSVLRDRPEHTGTFLRKG